MPAALDDLLERRNEGLAAVQPKTLGAGILHVNELLEAFSLDQLVQDGALALALNVMVLSGPSIRS
jgi:hypothetical protein